MKTEKKLRQLGSSGTYRGHWDLLNIVQHRKRGLSMREAVTAVAREGNVSAGVLQKRICRLMGRMEKNSAEGFLFR